MNKIIIGVVEKIKIIGKKEKEILARIDTGAEANSISKELAEELELGPIIKTVKIRSANGIVIRPIIKAKINFKGKDLDVYFNLADRKRMKYKVLLGQETLKNDFLIDPSK